MKGRCEPEQLIEWFHILVVMDDTVLLLSTSRRNMMKKLEILQQFCGVFDMMMNCSKTKFFVTNGQEGDTEPIQMNDLVIEHCINYVYLGPPFTCDGSVSSAVWIHAKRKLSHGLKYVSFLKKIMIFHLL